MTAARSITGRTQLAAVIGTPVRHSISPAIHNAAFAALDLDWVYLALEVREGEAKSALDAVRTFGIRGLSVTMPHKTAVADAVDELSDAARELRAVNCVVNRDGRLFGDNTDGAGFVDAFRHDTGSDIAGRRFGVVGGGGAARAVVRALAGAGASEVIVVNRSAAAATTAAALAGTGGRVGALADLSGCAVVINATPLGMAGPLEGAVPVPLDLLRPGQVVVDLVYNPLETPWLAAARAHGIEAHNGLSMLVFQAAHAFGQWTGVAPPIDAMLVAARQAVLDGPGRVGHTSNFPGGSLNFVGRMPTKDSSQDRSPEAKTVALQGTLDTFALPDVLRLLATTRKTGRLRVNGDRGSGSLWVEEGQLAASELIVPGATDDSLINTLFHLLRFKRGSFIFETGAMAPAGVVASDIEPMLDEAETMLVEWRSIEAVVPSIDAWLTLRPELAGSMVKIDNDRWRIIAAIGGGRSVGGVGEALGLDELPALRGVKEIVELGLVTVGTRSPGDGEADRSGSLVDEALSAPVADALPPMGEPADLRTQWEAPRETNGQSTAQPGFQDWDEPTGEWEESAPGYTYQPHDMAGPSSSELSGLGDAGLSDEPHYEPESFPEPARSHAYEAELDDPAEIARQLANLSPRAAKAVAAAAKAQTPEEREAALAAIEAEDDTVNRGLLLKFLGSVDS